MDTRNDTGKWTEATREQARIFGRCIPMQMAVHELRRALGRLAAGRVLTIGIGNPLMLHHLRHGEGSWAHVAPGAGDTAAIREVTGAEPAVLDWSALPFEDKTFDVVLVYGTLESAPDDEAFIHECHRVIRNDGRIILCVRNSKRFSLMRVFRRRLRAASARAGAGRDGYTEKDLFLLLKNGFDVIGMRSYTRFLVEAVDTWVQNALLRGRRPSRLYAAAGPLYRAAFQLDTLFLLTRGHRWIVVGKRRTWRARQAPILGDGRNISEAVLSRPVE